ASPPRWSRRPPRSAPPSPRRARRAGALDLEGAYELTDRQGISVGDELHRLGWVGELPAEARPLTAYVELHIEQGPILEDADVEIGVVTAGQGYRWYELELRGFPAHAGPTPMPGRRDPAQAIAGIIARVHEAADDLAPWARATFAQLSSEPATPNTIPEVVRCTLDLRHPELATLDELERRMRVAVDEVCAGLRVDPVVRVLSASDPVSFDPATVDTIRAAADELALSSLDIVSGAGHDACQVASVAPTAMIFVPCRDGLSHNEAEDITPEQAEQGASVLLEALRRLAG
ncbi:MAG: hydantoinase/carbamoylase family amidase, partial [Actinomycetota bacterium]